VEYKQRGIVARDRGSLAFVSVRGICTGLFGVAEMEEIEGKRAEGGCGK
jgi:hypothetical protein